MAHIVVVPLWFAAIAFAKVAMTPPLQAPPTAQLTRLICVTAELAEVEVTSTEPFPVRNALTELHVGSVTSSLSRYPDDGDTHTLIFSLSRKQLMAIFADDSAVVQYNPSNGQDTWLVGSIDPAAGVGCADERR